MGSESGTSCIGLSFLYLTGNTWTNMDQHTSNIMQFITMEFHGISSNLPMLIPSSVPGIDFYCINNRFVLVDLPGYPDPEELAHQGVLKKWEAHWQDGILMNFAIRIFSDTMRNEVMAKIIFTWFAPST